MSDKHKNSSKQSDTGLLLVFVCIGAALGFGVTYIVDSSSNWGTAKIGAGVGALVGLGFAKLVTILDK